MTAKLRTIGRKVAPSIRAKVTVPKKTAAPFYLSPEWRALMDQIIIERFGDRAHARCQDPECKTPHRTGIRIFGDHIKERKDGGALLDKRNILCRCGACHTRKTGEERAARYHRGGIEKFSEPLGVGPHGWHGQEISGTAQEPAFKNNRGSQNG
jgi:5-methylcytosine-specific restriction enzyme A